MGEGRNEVSYYPEIELFIEAQIKSNFFALNNTEVDVFWGIGELKKNLLRIIDENPKKCACVRKFANTTPPLSLDIFALITDGNKFKILILEVKLMNSAGLKEWSQLVGYCLVSRAQYGFLINIDHGASPRLSEILCVKENLSHIITIEQQESCEHFLGFMQWDSVTKSFDYSNLGTIKSISELCRYIAADFSKEK